MKKNILLIIFVLLLIPKSIKALEYKEKFRFTNNDTDLYNISETSDGNYVGANHNINDSGIAKFDKNGNILKQQNFESYEKLKPISDVMELSNGNYLVTTSNDFLEGIAGIAASFLCNKDLANCRELNINSMYQITNNSIFKFNNHYMIIGTSEARNDCYQGAECAGYIYTLYLYEVDNTGKVIRERTLDKKINDRFDVGCIAYSDGNTLNVFLINGDQPEIIEVSDKNIKTRPVNNFSLNESGSVHSIIKDDNNNIFIQTSNHILKFDINNNLSVALENLNNDSRTLTLQSVIYTKNHFIVGAEEITGISDVGETTIEKRSHLLIIYDKNFNIEETINLTNKDLNIIADEISIGGLLNITKTKNGFLVSNRLESQSQIIGYEFPYNIKTETDGKGTIEVLSSGYGGEEITFKVTSPNNLKLSSLIIKTDSGETIEFSEDDIQYNSDNTISIKTNRFTMPYDDVTIQARWSSKIINPSTSSFNKLLVLIILIASVTPFIINRKANN